MSLRFKLKKSPLIKGSNLLHKDRTYSTNKEQVLALQFLENESAHFR